MLVLGKLKWDLAAVIAHDFLALILHRLSLPSGWQALVKKHAQTFLALCATNYTFAMYWPSMIVVGCSARPGCLLHIWEQIHRAVSRDQRQ